jgi:hypothetical protein
MTGSGIVRAVLHPVLNLYVPSMSPASHSRRITEPSRCQTATLNTLPRCFHLADVPFMNAKLLTNGDRGLVRFGPFENLDPAVGILRCMRIPPVVAFTRTIRRMPGCTSICCV